VTRLLLTAALIAAGCAGPRALPADARPTGARLAAAREAVAAVERSPSADLSDLRTRLASARAEVDAILAREPTHAGARDLRDRMDARLAELAPPGTGEPAVVDAEAAAQRLVGLVKGGGQCAEVRRASADLVAAAARLEPARPAEAARYRARAGELEREAGGRCHE